MLWILLGIPIGIILLYFGSEWLVDGAKKLSIRLGISPFTVGLTVVALGLAAPEVVTTLISNDPQIVIGSIVGSNIANIGIAIGIAAIIYPVFCMYSEIKYDIIIMFAAVLIVSAMALTGSLGLIEGLILLVGMCLFILYTLKHTKKTVCTVCKQGETEEGVVEESLKTPMWKCVLLVVAGIILLFVGVTAFIDGAKELAGMLGVPQLMTGLVIVAFGVCLPELCVCITAASRHENEILVSNIIGSVVFNCFFALGVGVIYTPVTVTYFTMTFHLPVMIMMSLLLMFFIRSSSRISRLQGAVLVSVYLLYVLLMVIFPQLTQGLVD